MEERKYTLEEIENWLIDNNYVNARDVLFEDLTHEKIQKANEPINEDQINLGL